MNIMEQKKQAQEFTFKQQKIAANMQIPRRTITDIELHMGVDQLDFLHERITAQLTAKIYESTIEERILSYHAPAPTFLDWLFRRKRKVEFDFKVKDLLIDPPANWQKRVFLRCYEINERINE